MNLRFGTGRVRLAVMLAALILALTGCAAGEADPQRCTITYQLQGRVVYSHSISPGQMPDSYRLTLEGAEFVGWLDENGNRVEPGAVEADTCYEALVYPLLTESGPYLGLDGDMLHPEEDLTYAQLRLALETLAAPGALDYFPEMPQGDEPVDLASLRALLSCFYDAETVLARFEGDGPVTRGTFAVGMHSLLGRTGDQAVLVSEGAVLPQDVYLEQPELAALMDSCVSYEISEAGLLWQEMDLITGYEPGFINLDGYLYYVQEDGRFLRNADLGRLHFGADGRYTSGDGELDDMVAGILAPIVAENPDADRLTLLRSAFEHCNTAYQYLRRDIYSFGKTGWEVEDAKEMISTGRGNCYNFAAAFWACARGLGYEARAVAGTCTDTNQPHGWVIIELDGKDYFFDPEWQYAYRQRGETGKDMFMIPKGQIRYWTYKWRE